MSTLRFGFLGRLLAGAAFLSFGSLALGQSTSDYTALVGTAGYTGFQQQNAPGSSAVRGESGVTTIRTSHSGLSQSKVKIFVPPGTMRFKVSMITYRFDQDARAAARFGKIPVSTYGDVVDGTQVTDQRKSLQRLLAGEELKFYSPANSGTLTIAGSENTDVTQSAVGGYIYLNFLSIPGGEMASFQTQMDVKESCYSNWYANASWDAAGNPSDSASHTCSGSTGGGGTTDPGTGGGTFSFSPEKLVVGSVESTTITPASGVTLPAVCTANSTYVVVTGRSINLSWLKSGIKASTPVVITCGSYSQTLTLLPAGGGTGSPALTGLSLSTDTLVVGASPSSIAVLPVPAAAVLPQCTVDIAGYLKVSGAVVSLGTNASSLTNTRTETLTCGAFSKTITIKPAGSTASVASEVITASDGKITLRLTLKQPAADVATGITTNVWVGAYVPAGAIFFNEPVWFFKTPTTWREIDSIDINAFAFSRNQPSAVSKVYEVPLGLSAVDMRPFGIEVYFGYANSNGTFVNLGKVWSGNK